MLHMDIQSTGTSSTSHSPSWLRAFTWQTHTHWEHMFVELESPIPVILISMHRSYMFLSRMNAIRYRSLLTHPRIQCAYSSHEFKNRFNLTSNLSYSRIPTLASNSFIKSIIYHIQTMRSIPDFHFAFHNCMNQSNREHLKTPHLNAQTLTYKYVYILIGFVWKH
jgi:hypothetical protein